MSLLSVLKMPFKMTLLSFSILWFSLKLCYNITTLLPLLSYITWVFLTTFAMVAAHEKELVEAMQETYNSRKINVPLSVALALVSEAPHYIAILKIWFILSARFWNVFTHWIGWFAMIVDILGFAGCALLYYENFASVQDMVVQAKLTSNEDPHLSAINLIGKSIAPLYPTGELSCYRCVGYFGANELRENSTKRLTLHEEGLLDIYTRDYAPGSKRPVVMYIHGGSWTMGSKDVPNAMARVLSERGLIVVNVNYRLAHKFAMPAGFMDVKLALIWVKRNIEAYGGDPNFVMTAGDSAGGHLAQLVSMTPNVPEFQSGEGHTDVDTSVQGSILIAPVLDLMDKYKLPRASTKPEWFRREICGGAEMSVAESLAPLKYMSKSMPPTLCFHGDSDNLVDYRQSTHFEQECKDLGIGNKFTLITMPKTHHAHMIFNSPRVIAQGHIAADWALNLWLSTTSR